MKIRQLVLLTTAPLLLFSCVSSKVKPLKRNTKNWKQSTPSLNLIWPNVLLKKPHWPVKKKPWKRTTLMNSKVTDLNGQVDYLKSNNNQALKQLESLSVISSQQAESIKKSMDNIGAKDAYIQTLQQQMAKDSLNMTLVMNLKGAIGNLDDEDVNIKVDKGVVYIDISDKLLFKSGSYEVTDKAKSVLGKVAQVLKNQPDMEFMVEGHTDNVPYKGAALLDNWDTSVKRATTIVRLLQKGLWPGARKNGCSRSCRI